jgi:hypothetical protein
MLVLKIDTQRDAFCQHDFHHTPSVDFDNGIGLVGPLEVPIRDFPQCGAEAGGDAEFQCFTRKLR